ncbi:MAG TPA: polyamine aminopropyltransferase [Aliidongia sp.]|nr:polyamine aminopropyltransferase [Aliidongia sp.]
MAGPDQSWFTETLHAGVAQRLVISRLIHHGRTEWQEVMVFDNPVFGRVVALDGALQVTERDEFIYHEMLTHVPILAHGRVRRVLIMGGGDGGILRRCLMHAGVAEVTMVEIDGEFVELMRRHVPSISAGAFEDARVRLVIGDGAEFMRMARDFDVIIVDSTDPTGPGAVLFSPEFYADCQKALTPGGVLVTQSGVPFLQDEELTLVQARLGAVFADATCYQASIPTYYGGAMAFGWASDDAGLRRHDRAALAARYEAAGLVTRYYTPEIHQASFALPGYFCR